MIEVRKMHAKTLFKSLTPALLCTLQLASAAWAEKISQWDGYLVDRSCRASIEGSEQPLSFIRAQTRECALMPSCRKAGYAIYADGKWFNLDKGGNKLAEKYLSSTKRSKAFYVHVDGSLDGSTIVVSKINEKNEPKPAIDTADSN
jgi:hypothetical protein